MNIFSFIRNLMNSGSQRSVVVKRNIFWSFAIKGLSILTSLLLVPLTLNMLDNEKYGIWITMYSIVTWFNMMDIGLGNGFRNKFAEAVTQNNIEKARKLTETIYGSSIIIAGIFFVIYSVAHPFINWHKVLNIPKTFDENISLIVFWVFTLFAFQMILKNIGTILLALQKTASSNMVQFLGNLLSLLAIMILGKMGHASLKSISFVFMLSPLVIYLFYTIILFSKKLKNYKPRKLTIQKQYFHEIMSLGIKFFVIQITTIIMFSAGNFLIIQLYGPDHVTPYNISYRLFSSTMIIFTIIITPFWSAYTEAMAKNDYIWIKNSFKILNKIWMAFILIIAVLLLASPFIYELWIGDMVEISFMLSASFALYAALLSWNAIYAQFLNGTGKIKIQLIVAIFQSISNIPISLFLAKYLNWGISGIVMATNVNLFLSAVILHLQVKRISNRKAVGIWNE